MPSYPPVPLTIDHIPDDGTPPARVLTTTTEPFTGLVGTDYWEQAEQHLVQLFRNSGWQPGTYRYTLGRQITIERTLPLHPTYDALTYKPNALNPNAPIRAYVVHLAETYPNATINLIADHLDAFDKHYHGTISSTELTKRTGGYTLPPDVRPHSHWAPDDLAPGHPHY
jgi:hypothetical protein